MLKRGQKGELAVTLSIIGLLVSLLGITAGVFTSLDSQSSRASAQGLYTYKSTLEVRLGSKTGPVIPFEPGFTWDNGLQGKVKTTSGNISNPFNTLAQLVYDATQAPGVPVEIQGTEVGVVVRVPDTWDVIDAFCEDVKGTTCATSKVTLDFRTRYKLLIANGAEIKYGIVVNPKGIVTPTVAPTSIPQPSVPTPSQPAPTITVPVPSQTAPTITIPVPSQSAPSITPSPSPVSTLAPSPACPVLPANCAPKNVTVVSISDKSVGVTWDKPVGCPAYSPEVNSFWIDVVNIGNASQPGYIACIGESKYGAFTCNLGEKVIPNRLLNTSSYEHTQKKWIDDQDYMINVFTYNPSPSCVSPVGSAPFAYQSADPLPTTPPQQPSGDLILKVDTTTGAEFYDKFDSSVEVQVRKKDNTVDIVKSGPIKGVGIAQIKLPDMKGATSLRIYIRSAIGPQFTYGKMLEGTRAGFSSRINKIYSDQALATLLQDVKNGKIVETKSFIDVITHNDTLNNGGVPPFYGTIPFLQEPLIGNQSIVVRSRLDRDMPPSDVQAQDISFSLYAVHDALVADTALWGGYQERVFHDRYPDKVSENGSLAGINITNSNFEDKFGPLSDGWYIIGFYYPDARMINGHLTQIDGCERSYATDRFAMCLVHKKHDSDNIITFTTPVKSAAEAQKSPTVGAHLLTSEDVTVDSAQSAVSVCSSTKCLSVPLRDGLIDTDGVAAAVKSLGNVAYVSCSLKLSSGETITCPETVASYNQTQYFKLMKGTQGYSASILNQSSVADFDGDGLLSGVDLANLIDTYQTPGGDVNGDKLTNALDLGIFITLMGKPTVPSTLYDSSILMN
jgi:hypothetical protein